MSNLFLHRKAKEYLSHYYANTNRALLVTGARQIGKTYSIRQLGKEFDCFVEFNFLEQPEVVELLRQANKTKDILLHLSVLAGKPLIKGKTLVFFDEVQCYPDIVTAIKFLVDEGSYRYVLSGSLLGVGLRDLRSEPVGYMGVYEMYPLDFREFTQALNIPDEAWDVVRTAWENETAVDDFIHRKMLEAFRLYMLIGGMPRAVTTYLETNNFQNVLQVQQDILTLYKRDIAQYDPEYKLQIEEIFTLIPPELNAKNKRFILKNLNENKKFSAMENSFLWLRSAGVALPVYNIEEPKTPLLLSRSRNLFKLFQNDIGLLACQYAKDIQLRLLMGDKDINYGAPYENVVAQELNAHGFPLYYYNNKKRGEVDFVLEQAGKVLPIEVKSGKNYARHNALDNLMASDYDLPRALVLNNDNVRKIGKILYVPIYMVALIEHQTIEPIEYTFSWTD